MNLNPFAKLKRGLDKTRDNLVGKVGDLFTGKEEYSPEVFEELEELLIEADLGVELALDVAERVEKKLKGERVSGDDLGGVLEVMGDTLREELRTRETESVANGDAPRVILVVGVNGVGKTTSVAKLAHNYKSQGKRVLLAAADTFRAAAIEQLGVWAERLDCEIVRHQDGADPSAVVYDAVVAAKARKVDVILIDTAGRLHNKEHLMEELAKMRRVISREIEGAPHEVLLVLDANTGQNAIQQSRVFKEATEVTGIVLAKLDGTARGGVVFAIGRELGIPVQWVGLGEQIGDLEPFDADAFASALLARD